MVLRFVFFRARRRRPLYSFPTRRSSDLGPLRLLGVSAATPAEARAALAAGADYVGTGTIYATGSKADAGAPIGLDGDRKSTRLNSSHLGISYAVFCLKKKTME